MVKLMRLADSNVPCCGKIYNGCFQLEQGIDKISTISAAKRKEIKLLVSDRWEMLAIDIQRAAYLLDPELLEADVQSNEEVMIMLGFWKMVEKLVLDPDEVVKVVSELELFRSGKGMFSKAVAKASAKQVPAYQWWSSFGASTPVLQQVAIKVLSRVASACSCEHNWSTFEFIHSRKRNRLEPARANALVYVFSNLRLIKHIGNLEYEEEFPEWDSDEEEVVPASST